MGTGQSDVHRQRQRHHAVRTPRPGPGGDMPGKGKLRKVLTPKSRPARPASAEEGFTLIELVIVLLIMTVVIVVATGALISLSQTTNRGSAMITDEQQASTTMTQLAKDIRSAHAISIPTGATAANQVILQDNN